MGAPVVAAVAAAVRPVSKLLSGLAAAAAEPGVMQLGPAAGLAVQGGQVVTVRWVGVLKQCPVTSGTGTPQLLGALEVVVVCQHHGQYKPQAVLVLVVVVAAGWWEQGQAPQKSQGPAVSRADPVGNLKLLQLLVVVVVVLGEPALDQSLTLHW